MPSIRASLHKAPRPQHLDEAANECNADGVAEGRDHLVDHIGGGKVLDVLAGDPSALRFVVVDLEVNALERLLAHQVDFLEHVQQLGDVVASEICFKLEFSRGNC